MTRFLDGPQLAALADDPLCLLMLLETLNTDIRFERVCRRLRCAFLKSPIESAVQPLLAALAMQAWNNEYLWEETAEETAAVAGLPAEIAAAGPQALEPDRLASATLPLLRWAMYRPLSDLPAARALAARPLGSVPPVLRPLWQRTLLAPREEAALRAALPAFGDISDATSHAVRTQYEENPYPRWQRLSAARKSVLECHRTLDPKFAWPVTFRAPLQILIAGCGTGEHPLRVAAANPQAEVLAVDLSLARQVSLNRVVALKMILAGELAGEDEVKRFREEAQLAAGLQHPGIVALHEVGEHEGQHYFSMDYIEGRSLAQMTRGQPLPPPQAVRYVRLIAEAIHFAHLQGVLHRDLKPSNVLIDRFDQPRVTDFGLAKNIRRDAGLTDSGAVLGTPSYMPPEQASGDRSKVGPASDVYALGAVLYELVTGRPPFQAATQLDTLLQVLEAEPAPPRLLNPAVSREGGGARLVLRRGACEGVHYTARLEEIGPAAVACPVK
jgi:serine/threonine protein kinase